MSTSNIFLGTGDVCVNNRADSVLWMNRLQSHIILICYLNFNT